MAKYDITVNVYHTAHELVIIRLVMKALFNADILYTEIMEMHDEAVSGNREHLIKTCEKYVNLQWVNYE